MKYFLFESSLGYSLYKLNGIDKLSLKDPKVMSSIDSFQDFKKLVSLEASYFFHGHNVAWQSIEDLKNDKIPENLQEFLSSFLPAKKKIQLAVQDKNFAQALNKELKYKCISGELCREIFRGIRTHLAEFLSSNEIEGIDTSKITQANLGLGHALARNNIKFDEKKQDKTIINSFSLLDQMEKNLNTFCMRIKEGYGWHFPELSKLVTNNEMYVKLVKLIGNKENIKEIALEDLQEIVQDGELVNKILERQKSSMGNELNPIDEKSLIEFVDYVLRHFEYKRNLQDYLRDEMNKVAPNLTALLGESVGAKLLTHAGGLNNLAKLPSSTIQILGAEKALFRAIKKRGATPKYGLLFNSSYITKAQTNQKGRISRMLANKCALASRLDHFLVKPSNKFGLHFKQLLEQRLDQPENVELGKRNIQEMEDLVDQMTQSGEYVQMKKLKEE